MSNDGLSRQEVLAKVREHLSTELEVPLDGICETTRFRDDLDADSLDLYELVMELEDTYGIKVSEEEASRIDPRAPKPAHSLRHRPYAGRRPATKSTASATVSIRDASSSETLIP